MTPTEEPLRSPEKLLADHKFLVDEAYDLLLEENKFLKETGQPTQASLLGAKQHLLEKIGPEVDCLRELADSFRPRDPALREQLNALQNKLMKLFYLDRENEQLLLQMTVQSPANSRPGGVRQEERLRNAYAR
jgi:hypothetical protein